MYKEDLVLNNLQGLICHKTKPHQFIPSDSQACLVYMIIRPSVFV